MPGIDFKPQENGTLKITADEEGREILRDAYADGGYKKALNVTLAEAAHDAGYTMVAPEWIGALTDAPIIGEDVTYPEDGPPEVDGRVWWFPDYAVVDEIQKLIDHGEVTFALGEEWDQTSVPVPQARM